MSNKFNQLKWGALLSYLGIVFNILSGLLYTPWMIRTIGDDQYALYTLALSVINIFLLDFGIGASVTKFLSNYYAKNQQEEANRFMGIVYKVFLVISLIVAACLLVFYFIIDRVYLKLTPAELATFKNLYLIVAAYSVLSFPFTTFNGVLMANERFIEVKACSFGQKVFSVVLIVLFLILGKGVYAMVLVHAISNVVFLALKYYFIRKSTRQRANMRSWNGEVAKQLFGFSIWITVISIAQRCIFNIMPTLIAATIGSAAVTVFSLAATLEGYVFAFADAVNGMFMPRISRILETDESEKQLSELMSSVGRFHVYSIGLLYIGFICVGKQFVSLWLGEGYDAVYVCAVLLIFPSMIDVPQQIAKTTLMVSDIVKEQGFIYILMATVNLVLAFTLMPILGIVGAAVSVCIAYLVRTAAFNVLYHKRLDIDLVRYFKKTYLRWFIVAGITMAAGVFVREIPMNGWAGLLVKAVLIGTIYATMLLLIGIETATREKITRKVFNLIRKER